MGKFFVLFGVLIQSLAFGASDDTIFAKEPQRATVSFTEVLNAPAFRENRDEVLALAEAKVESSEIIDGQIRSAMVGALRELPFHRVVDVQVAFFSGIPDVIGLCLEGHPTNRLAIEACASTALLMSSATATAYYRWDIVAHRTSGGRIHQLSAGPGFGVRYTASICFDTCENRLMADMRASLEYVYWLSRYFGFTAQLDLGATYMFYTLLGPEKTGLVPIPTGKFTVGVAF